MIFIGFDPGITGGIAAIDHKGEIRLLEPMPVMPGPIAKRNIVDGRQLAAMLRGVIHYDRTIHIAVEQVGSRPGQAGVAMFSFGTSYGTVLGVLGAMGLGYQFVHPTKWQKANSLSADKKQTLGWAMRRWPHLELKASHDGMADALGIADWLRQQHAMS